MTIIKKGFNLDCGICTLPLQEIQRGYKHLYTMVSKRAGYIAKVNGSRNFPWRLVVITDNDAADAFTAQ